MDRTIVYAGAIPQDTDLLLTNKNAMVGLGMLMQAILGTSTWIDGLTCAPTAPASMSVQVGPGSIYSQQNIDNSAYGSVAADTSDQIVKQGIVFGEPSFACPAPATSGFSVAYLIQATYQDVDGGATVLPYYNASNPSVAFNGPNNTGTSQNTVRQGKCVLTLKAGTPAATGSQALPAADVGAMPVASVTVANGQTTIVSGNIFQLGNYVPKLTALLAIIQSGSPFYGIDSSGAANTITMSLNPGVSALTAGQPAIVKVANTNTGPVVINTNSLGNVAANLENGSAIPAGMLKANGIYLFTYDGNHWQLQSPMAGAFALGQCKFVYTSATQCKLMPKGGNKVAFPSGDIPVIPATGIASTITSCYLDGTPGSSLSASTQYYAYLANIGGTYVIDWSVTAYAQDAASGIMCKSSDITRVLVGRAVLDASSHLQDADGQRQFYSWFNKERKRSRTVFTADRSTASSAFVELGSDIRNFIAPWAGDNVDYEVTGGVINNSTQTAFTGIGFDGTSPEQETSCMGASGVSASDGAVAIAGQKTGLSEGLHYATVLGAVNASTSTWPASTVISGSPKSQVNLNLFVMG